jgi:hypothetical protein
MAGQLWHIVAGSLESWFRTKMFIEHASAISSDAMHMLAGVLVQLLVAFIGRRSISSWLPWLVLLGLASLNEFIDLWMEQWPDLAVQYGESAKDLLLSMTLPTVLLFASRWRPRLFVSPPKR